MWINIKKKSKLSPRKCLIFLCKIKCKLKCFNLVLCFIRIQKWIETNGKLYKTQKCKKRITTATTIERYRARQRIKYMNIYCNINKNSFIQIKPTTITHFLCLIGEICACDCANVIRSKFKTTTKQNTTKTLTYPHNCEPMNEWLWPYIQQRQANV